MSTDNNSINHADSTLTMTALDKFFTKMEESSRNRSTNLKNLMMMTCQVMSVLETWNHAKCKHPEAVAIIGRVQSTTADFIIAISRSGDVAQRGVAISHQMVVFCDGMSDKMTTLEDLENFVSNMALPAKEAHRRAKDVETNFREVREGLLVTTNQIPGAAAKVQGEREHETAKIRKAQKIKERAQFVKVCTSSLAAVFGGISTFTCEPVLIVLPIALPLIALVAGIVEKRMVAKMTERETRVQSCQEALGTLHKAADDLARLDRCINEFASFWTLISGVLENVVGRLELLRQRDALKLRLVNLRSSWEEVAQSYHDYAVKVEYLREIVGVPPTSNKKGAKGVF